MDPHSTRVPAVSPRSHQWSSMGWIVAMLSVCSALLVGLGTWGLNAQWNEAFGPIQGHQSSAMSTQPHWIAKAPFTVVAPRALPPLAKDGRFDAVCANAAQREEEHSTTCASPHLLYAPQSSTLPQNTVSTPLSTPAAGVVGATVDFGSQQAARRWIAGDVQQRSKMQQQIASLPINQQPIAQQALANMDKTYHGCPTRQSCGWSAKWVRGAGKAAEGVVIAAVLIV